MIYCSQIANIICDKSYFQTFRVIRNIKKGKIYMEEVFEYLKKMNISYEVVYHPAAMTTEEADKYVEGKEGVLSKSLFMAGKKDRNFYLFIMDDSKMLDIKKMSEIVGDKLHFSKEEHLQKKMGLAPGIVSLFGLLNDKGHEINVFIDEEIIKEKTITFHPNDNTATIFIGMSDMFKILEDLNYDYKIIKF